MKKFLKMGALAVCLAVSPAKAEESTVIVSLSDAQTCTHSIWISREIPGTASGNSGETQR